VEPKAPVFEDPKVELVEEPNKPPLLLAGVPNTLLVPPPNAPPEEPNVEVLLFVFPNNPPPVFVLLPNNPPELLLLPNTLFPKADFWPKLIFFNSQVYLEVF